MNTNNYLVTKILLCVWTFLSFGNAWGQALPQRLDSIKTRLASIRHFADKLPPNKKKLLSVGAQNMLQTAKEFEGMDEGLREMQARLNTRLAAAVPQDGTSANDNSAGEGRLIRVSRREDDFIFSQVGGFSQSETTTSWCNNNVVVGFNDSGSFLETLLGAGGLSFNGYARSINGGSTFTDLGSLNPGPKVFDFLLGDPVIACTSGSVFYYASLFETGTPQAPLSAISVSKSSDGGLTFGDPVVAASKDGDTHFLDKEWLAVDPTNPSRLFVTYTDFDFSLNFCGTDNDGFPIPRAAIELARSTNGGASWSNPQVIEELCSPVTVQGDFVQGSQVAVGPAGRVYVAWEHFDADFITRDIRIRASSNHGASFGPATTVTDVACVGDCFELQGGFRDFIDLNSLVIDRSGKSTNGNVYIAWQDGRNLRVIDLLSQSGSYSYSDILVTRSTNRGATWSTPVKVNDNKEPLPSGKGTDQYQVGIAVDKNGHLGACFYDRRRDVENWFIERTCAKSENAGETWLNNEIVEHTSFGPYHAADVQLNLLYMGDYDMLSSDFTLTHSGFVGAFQVISRRGDPNVVATKFVP